jgi:hypothetical protein
MSSHEELQEHLTPEEMKFRHNMTRGEDFIKIEIYRNARKYFQMALEMGTDMDHIKERISFCNLKIRQEKKIIISLAVIAVVVIGIAWCIAVC